jgi:hypothetical protein
MHDGWMNFLSPNVCRYRFTTTLHRVPFLTATVLVSSTATFLSPKASFSGRWIQPLSKSYAKQVRFAISSIVCLVGIIVRPIRSTSTTVETDPRKMAETNSLEEDAAVQANNKQYMALQSDLSAALAAFDRAQDWAVSRRCTESWRSFLFIPCIFTTVDTTRKFDDANIRNVSLFFSMLHHLFQSPFLTLFICGSCLNLWTC